MNKLIKITGFFALFIFAVLTINNKITVKIIKQETHKIKSKNILTNLNIKNNAILKKKNLFSGKNVVYIVNLWGAQCKPCIKEIPKLNKLVEKYKNKKVKFIAISRFNDDSLLFENFNIDFKFEKYYNEGKLFDYFQNLNPSKGKVIPILIIINNKGYIEYYFEGISNQNYQLTDAYLSDLSD